MASKRRIFRQRGISLILGTAALVVIIPAVGLTVDVGLLYVAKARLQGSVDGAVLAAARALTLKSNPTDQVTAAQQNATNWFYANLQGTNWGMTNTSITATVDTTSVAYLRTVHITATTYAPTYFMRWFGYQTMPVTAVGTASRRDVVIMLVLDRSGSMCSVGGVQHSPCGETDTDTPCAAMIKAAKIFTGQFAEGRDQIGLLTFDDGTYLDYSPSTTFQTNLGYTNTTGSGTGALDSIKCNGYTGTPAAISVAYNELYKIAEPGALNAIVLETDGLPNTVVYNWWDGAKAGLTSTSGCKDGTGTGTTIGNGGWKTLASMPHWDGGGHAMGPNGYMSDIPSGAIGVMISSDPWATKEIDVLNYPWQTNDNSGNSTIASSNGPSTKVTGCQFASGTVTDYSDFAWLPSQDIYGNQINPSNSYQSVTLTSGHLALSSNHLASTDWQAVHYAALNATDNSAYNARTNTTLPATFFVVGLGGDGGDPPDNVLLQRMANDPNGDDYNTPANYSPCAQETGCLTYTPVKQSNGTILNPTGTYVYSPDASNLGSAFLKISSQVLRLSQ